MRTILIGLAAVVTTTVLLAGIEPADAQQAPRPWCLQAGFGGPGGGLLECTYYTLQQCRAAIVSTDKCFSNPALGWDRLEGRGKRLPPRERGH